MLAVSCFERFEKLGGGHHVTVKCLLPISQHHLDHHPFHFSEKMLLRIESTSGRRLVVTLHHITFQSVQGSKALTSMMSECMERSENSQQ
jgi:hypothetical protein